MRILVCFMLFCGFAYAELYKVNVKRIEKDLYKTDDGFFIQTRYCYEYAYGEEAIYDDVNERLIFTRMSNSACDVKKVFK